MTTVGEYVQEAIDFMNSGSPKNASLPAALAVEKTIAASSGRENVSEGDFKNFLKEHWRLVVFMGMPRALPLPLSLPFAFKRIYPAFNVHHGAEEIVWLALRQTMQNGNLPALFTFNSNGQFLVQNNEMSLPVGLLTGLLGSVIFHPANRAETIGEKYWISISDFKMFISELWGRQDLAERIMRFYLERD